MGDRAAEAAAQGGGMSVYVRRGAGKCCSDEGVPLLPGGGEVTRACLSHCTPQAPGILEGRDESFWPPSEPVFCGPGPGPSDPEKTF